MQQVPEQQHQTDPRRATSYTAEQLRRMSEAEVHRAAARILTADPDLRQRYEDYSATWQMRVAQLIRAGKR